MIMKLVDKDALVAEIERLMTPECGYSMNKLLDYIDTLEVKEVNIDKLCEFRKNIGFAYPDGASEYQKKLACYRQGIEDTIKAQKGEEV